MSTIDDPRDPAYLDQAAVRVEMTRVFEVCNGCRQCVELCGVFPTMFDLIARFDDQDPGRLTPAEQDQVLARCVSCTMCVDRCPYAPDRHSLAVDVPTLMRRARAMRLRAGLVSWRERLTTQVLGRTDLFGRFATAISPAANRIVGAPPRSWRRRVMAAVTGVSAEPRLPRFAPERFSTWFRRRGGPTRATRPHQGNVIIYPTCIVEYQNPEVGRDLVSVFERNGVACSLSSANCCGAPWFQAGNFKRFRKVASRTVRRLGSELPDDVALVVPQPMCRQMLAQAYPIHLRDPQAAAIAARIRDPAEYLMSLRDGDITALDTDYSAVVAERITFHLACGQRASARPEASRELLELTGAAVSTVDQCSAMNGMWGFRAAHHDPAVAMADELARRIEREQGSVICGECPLSNTVIAERTGREVLHPMQLLARAYGLVADPTDRHDR